MERDGARCGKNVVANNKGYICADKDGCGFVLRKDNNYFKAFKKKLTPEIASALLKV